jgi:paraquat-inducible protein A
MPATTFPLPHGRSLAAQRGTLWIGIGLILALGLLVAAWILPIMAIERLPFWRSKVSLLDTVKKLAREREYFLLVVLCLFSMAFPVVKNLVGLWAWAFVDAGSALAKRSVGWIEAMGKWSMVDVFLVALTVAAIKISIIADVEVYAGIYLFCGSVILSMLLLHALGRAIARRGAATG